MDLLLDCSLFSTVTESCSHYFVTSYRPIWSNSTDTLKHCSAKTLLVLYFDTKASKSSVCLNEGLQFCFIYLSINLSITHFFKFVYSRKKSNSNNKKTNVLTRFRRKDLVQQNSKPVNQGVDIINVVPTNKQRNFVVQNRKTNSL